MTDPPRILARFTSYGGMLDALRDRLDELGIAHGTFDRIAGLADGYTNKVLKPAPNRYLLPNTLQCALEGAATELWLVEKPEETAKLKARSDFEPVKWPKKRVKLHQDGFATPRQVRTLAPLIAAEMGRKGAAKANAMRDAAQASQIGQYAAFCRWKIRMRKFRRRAKNTEAT